MSTLSELLTIVVICYDPYEDAIKLSPYFLNKYWNNRTVDAIYVTSTYSIDENNIVNLKTNGDLSYNGRLQLALNNVNTKYVLLLLDDYLINADVDENNIMKCVNYMKENNIDYYQLCTIFRRPNGKKLDKNHMLVSAKRRYRINLLPSIISIDLLNELLATNPTTAWQAELNFMDKKFSSYDAYFCLNKYFTIINYIDKGQVTRKARRFLKKEKKWEKQRKVMSVPKTIKKYVANNYKFLKRFIPKRVINKLKGTDNIYK